MACPFPPLVFPARPSIRLDHDDFPNSMRRSRTWILVAALSLAVIVTAIAIWRGGHQQPPEKRQLGEAQEQLASGNSELAEVTLKDLLRKDPANAMAYAELGNLYLLHRSLPRAIQALETAAALDPNQKHVFSRLAQAYLDARWQQEAAQAAAEAFRREPNSTYTLLISGELSLRDDDFTTALSRFQKAINLDPSQDLGRVKVGFILIKLQRYDEAVEVLEDGLKQNPQNSAFHYQLAETYFLRPQLPGAADRAEKHYQLALPNNPSAASCHARLGELGMRRNDLTLARRHWSRCLEMDSGNATALNGLAQVAAREGNSAESRSLLNRLEKVRRQEREYSALSARARADEASGDAALKAARYAFQHGMISDAERRIQDAVRRSPDLREARELRAALYRLQGRRSEARFELRVASGLRTFPGAETIQPSK